MFTSMIVFISVIWFTTKMAKDTEIIPIWFSGSLFQDIYGHISFQQHTYALFIISQSLHCA